MEMLYLCVDESFTSSKPPRMGMGMWSGMDHGFWNRISTTTCLSALFTLKGPVGCGKKICVLERTSFHLPDRTTPVVEKFALNSHTVSVKTEILVPTFFVFG